MKTVLLVVTSQGSMGDSGRQTGVWLEELAAPYYEFSAAGFRVRIASIAGGKPRFDSDSLQGDFLTDTGRRFQADPVAMRLFESSERVAEVDPASVDAVFLVGGAGCSWDFHDDASLTSLVNTVAGRRGVISGVCHGVVGLVKAQAPDGRPLVAGRAVTGFSLAEEVALGFENIVPVIPEVAFRQLGARYSSAGPWAAHVVQDGALITGQNPASAGPAARAVVTALR